MDGGWLHWRRRCPSDLLCLPREGYSLPLRGYQPSERINQAALPRRCSAEGGAQVCQWGHGWAGFVPVCWKCGAGARAGGAVRWCAAEVWCAARVRADGGAREAGQQSNAATKCSASTQRAAQHAALAHARLFWFGTCAGRPRIERCTCGRRRRARGRVRHQHAHCGSRQAHHRGAGRFFVGPGR